MTYYKWYPAMKDMKWVGMVDNNGEHLCDNCGWRVYVNQENFYYDYADTHTYLHKHCHERQKQ